MSFLEARSKLISFYTKFWVKTELDFRRSNVLFYCCAANQCIAFFQRLQTEIRALRVNETKIQVKMLLMEIILGPKVTMNQFLRKNTCFGYFCRFVTHALTLRPWITYFYVFRAFFDFCNLELTLCPFWKLEANSFHSTLNAEPRELEFWRTNVLVPCCVSNQYSEITCIFSKISNRSPRSKG